MVASSVGGRLENCDLFPATYFRKLLYRRVLIVIFMLGAPYKTLIIVCPAHTMDGSELSRNEFWGPQKLNPAMS